MIDPTVYFVPNLFNLDQHELSANLRVKIVDSDLLFRGHRYPNLFNLDQHELSANLRVKAVDPDLLKAINPTVYFDPTLKLGPLANHIRRRFRGRLFIEASKTTY